MTRMLILGAGGMAGHVITTYFSECGHKVSTVTAHHKVTPETSLIDVTDRTALTDYLNAHTFDVVVNCIGMLVKPSEERKDLAVYLNAYLPHFLENHYKDSATKIIHLSTDCVFSGDNPPYTESSWPDGPLFYDRSKALGELRNDKDLTIRMSIIGPDSQERGTGLFNWFYAQTGDIKGYTASIWNGITTIQLAKAIDAALQQNITGLYQLAPHQNISKYDLLQLFVKVFERHDITITPVEGPASDKSLSSERTDFDFTLPDYPQMVKEMRDWIKDHPTLYAHYVKK